MIRKDQNDLQIGAPQAMQVAVFVNGLHLVTRHERKSRSFRLTPYIIHYFASAVCWKCNESGKVPTATPHLAIATLLRIMSQ